MSEQKKEKNPAYIADPGKRVWAVVKKLFVIYLAFILVHFADKPALSELINIVKQDLINYPWGYGISFLLLMFFSLAGIVKNFMLLKTNLKAISIWFLATSSHKMRPQKESKVF